MHVVSDDQNGQGNDQRRNRDIETTRKPMIPFASATTKSLFFFNVVFSSSSSSSSSKRSLNIFFDAPLWRDAFVAFPRTKKKEPFKFRVSYKTLNRSVCALDFREKKVDKLEKESL